MSIRKILDKVSRIIPDKMYLKIKFRLKMGKRLDLKNPKTFNEKLQWLKLYDRKPEYSVMVDKCDAKTYVADIIGEEYIIPTLGVWDSIDEIDFEALPEKFVIKCTNDSGGLVICTDKSKLDIEKTKKILRHSFKTNYFWHGREWPYKNLKPRVIAEKYMTDSTVGELRDYKFFCFDGKVDCVMICSGRAKGTPRFFFFDEEWKLHKYNLSSLDLPDDYQIEKPDNIDEMFKFAKILSKGLPYARIDMYSIEGKTYFGEITFFPASGLDEKLLPFVDEHWGNMIKLPEKES